jgi:hypothetical protein
MKDNLNEMDKKIKQFKSVLDSLQISYKNINEFDVDGHQLNDIELEFLNLKDEKINNNSALPSLLENSNKNLENTTIECDEDIDGEPI